MTTSANPTIPAFDRIAAALLDYFDAPGKYPVGSRRPEVLFHAIDNVLLIAAGRAPGTFGAMPDGLRDAAAFFVGAALLYPGADHYTLLGLPAASAPDRLKERYRLLMRLVHPDFAGSVRANWPKDSAMRVNRAYEVLSSPVLRREYDEQLAGTAVHHRGTASHSLRRSFPASPRARPVPRLRMGKRAAWIVIVLLCLMAAGMLLPHRDPGGIVQKPNSGAADFGRAVLLLPKGPSKPVSETETDDASKLPPFIPAGPPAGAFAEFPPPLARKEARIPQVDAMEANPPAQRIPPAPVISLAQPALPMSIATPSTPARAPEESASLGPEPRSAIVHAATTPRPPATATTAPEAAAAPVRVVATRSRAAPTLMDAQPLLGQLLQSLESGKPEQLLHLLEVESRQGAGAQALSRQYGRLVGRASQVTLSHAEFKSEPRDDVLIVTGHLRLQVDESTIGSHGEKLMLRAMFESRGGRVILIGLSGVTE